MIADKYEVEEYKNTKHCENCVNKSDDILVENKKEDNSILATVDKFALDHPVATVAAVAIGISFFATVTAVAIVSEGVHRGNMKTLYSLYKLTR
jgi:C4-type Zn-finger protein